MFGKVKSGLAILLASSTLLTQAVVESKLVFAHYMVGTVDSSTDHAKKDIDGAASVGFDAFALNVGYPDKDFVKNTAQQLFDYAGSKNFKLFFSFDFYATSDISAHKKLFDQFKDNKAYLRYGSDNRPVVSSYSGGQVGPDAWKNFKDQSKAYVLPNPEAAENYYKDPATFFKNWGSAVDGVFSWETAWPPESDKPGNVSSSMDEAVKKAADAAKKSYMMGLSPLQYKHCCGDSWYKPGETNLPERIEQILSLSPEFAEVITWNDAGESHYIGPTWKEGLTDEILQYGNSEKIPHDGWQPLISSFIDAFKAGSDASAMKPRSGKLAGAAWYRPVTKSCTASLPRYSDAALDSVNYAIVVGANAGSGLKVRISSGGSELATRGLSTGLNYGAVAGLRTGAQKLEVLDGAGTVLASASGAGDVSDQPGDGGFCNYNYYVAGLK
ncbi:glycoside hydrolase family 71 protein [Xylariaceae sp. FL0662B]|nr:glycoside hydrolase family 71 protein [Xylariaceae sp. FL0662B]